MIEREQRDHTETLLVVTRVACDRCGGDLKRVTGVSLNHEWEGAFIRGDLYPTHNLADAERIEVDLCGDCLKDLKEWVEEGRIWAETGNLPA